MNNNLKIFAMTAFLIVAVISSKAYAAEAYNGNNGAGHWCYPYAERLQKDGYINGNINSMSYLDEKVTVDQFMELITNAQGLGEVADAGNEPNATNYKEALTRGEMAAILKSRLKLNSQIPSKEIYQGQIKDFIDTPEKYKEAILCCYINGIILGSDNVIRPQAFVSRGEMLVTLARVIYPEYRRDPLDENSLFYVIEIPDALKPKMFSKTIKDTSLVAFDDLRYISVAHYGYDDNTRHGEIIMHRDVAEEVLEIFKTLYRNKFPIERMRLPYLYGGVDEDSMSHNNTSGFNDRPISSTSRSYHQMGLALDINPLYNPYHLVGTDYVAPKDGAAYLDRTKKVKGTVSPDDICTQTFKKNGWTWGGDWRYERDYQHFQKGTVISLKDYVKPTNKIKPSAELFNYHINQLDNLEDSSQLVYVTADSNSQDMSLINTYERDSSRKWRLEKSYTASLSGNGMAAQTGFFDISSSLPVESVGVQDNSLIEIRGWIDPQKNPRMMISK